jgi:hypothetical protein
MTVQIYTSYPAHYVENYFSKILTHIEVRNGIPSTYVVRVAPRADRSMVLFGGPRQNVPLAALTTELMTDPTELVQLPNAKKGGAATALLVGRPSAALKFHLHNLSFDGYINFNILHTRHHVREVDPGPAYGVNRVNELRPRTSTVIETDQRTGRPITIDNGSEPFHLSVVAESESTKLIELLSHGTEWRCVDYFVEEHGIFGHHHRNSVYTPPPVAPSSMMSTHEQSNDGIVVAKRTRSSSSSSSSSAAAKSSKRTVDDGAAVPTLHHHPGVAAVATAVPADWSGLTYDYDHPSTPHQLRVTVDRRLVSTIVDKNTVDASLLSSNRSNVQVGRKEAWELIDRFISNK